MSLSDLKKTRGTMNGSRKMLIGKKVIVIPPNTSLKDELFLSLMMFIRLIASRLFQLVEYRLMNMATRKDKSIMLKMYTTAKIKIVPYGLIYLSNF